MKLLARIEKHARERGEAVAYREVGGRAMSYGELWERSGVIAERIRAAAPEGGAVVVCVGNVIEFPVAFLGILRAGCQAIPVSEEIAAVELEQVLRQVEVLAIVRADEIAPTPALPRSTGGGRMPRSGLLLQSSGTTGRPKIVMRSGESMDAVGENCWRSIGFGEGDIVMSAAPLCHSYGLEHGLLAPMMAGSEVRLCRGFDVGVIERELRESAVSIFPGVPSMFEMLGQRGEEGTRFRSLRVAYSAGAQLPRSVFEVFERKFGVRVGQLYGLTELGSITFSSPEEEEFDPASVGRGMQGVEFRVVDGQVLGWAPSMFSGYVGEEAGLVDGFFPTGDLGRLDERGRLTITGRLKLLIDVGGLKVNPIEVEEVISQHPAVGSCVVVPMRLSETVFRLKAVLTPRNGAVPVEEVRRFARERLTAYKVPRVFEVRENLPRSATGKVLRHLVEAS